MQFTRATKQQAKLRLALIGLAGSGKSWSSLAIAEHLVPIAGRDDHADAGERMAKRPDEAMRLLPIEPGDAFIFKPGEPHAGTL